MCTHTDTRTDFQRERGGAFNARSARARARARAREVQPKCCKWPKACAMQAARPVAPARMAIGPKCC